MKNITLSIFVITIFSLLSCAPNHNVPKDMFVIKGSIKNIPDSSVMELRTLDGHIMQVLATDTITNGVFEFCDSIPTDDKYLALGSRSDGFSNIFLYLWVESQTYVEIKGDGGLIVDWGVKSTLPRQKEETEYIKAGFPEALEYAQISVEVNRYRQKAIETMLKTGRYSYGDDKDEVDSLERLTAPLQEKVNIKRLQYLKTVRPTEHWMQNYSTLVQSLQYYKEEGKNELVKIIEELYQLIPSELLESEKGEFITSYIHPPTTVEEGDDMVDCELFDTQGRLHTLSQFEGKYILIDFWSAGCGPCIAAAPEMERMSEKYENVAIVSISLDNKSIWEEAIKLCNLKGLQLNELSSKTRFTIRIAPSKRAYLTMSSYHQRAKLFGSGQDMLTDLSKKS